jgi:N-methylhydantoinase A
VHTIGAGGGSIAWLDEGGALRVGPRSAGARPGPACYGLGGEAPTVTDANLVLGYLADGAVLGGEVTLDRELAERALAQLPVDELSQERPTSSLRDWDLTQRALAAAVGVVRVVDAEMARALRVVTVERGVDPRRFALMPFGGAGPMHAAAIAEELGIERLLCPRAGGVLSAFGLCASDRRRDTARTVMLSGDDLTAARIAAAVAELREIEAAGLEGARVEVEYGMRYSGQAFELQIPGDPEPDPGELVAAFERAHEERYGHRDPDGDVVLVDIRLALILDGPDPRPSAATTGSLEESTRRVRFADEWHDTPVLRGEPESTRTATGPIIFELPEATLVLPPHWEAEVDVHGTIRAHRTARAPGEGDPERTSPQFVREGSPSAGEARPPESLR